MGTENAVWFCVRHGSPCRASHTGWAGGRQGACPPSLTATSTHRLTLGLAVTTAAAASPRAVSMGCRGVLSGDRRWRHSGQRRGLALERQRQAASGAWRRRLWRAAADRLAHLFQLGGSRHILRGAGHGWRCARVGEAELGARTESVWPRVGFERLERRSQSE